MKPSFTLGAKIERIFVEEKKNIEKNCVSSDKAFVSVNYEFWFLKTYILFPGAML